MTGPEHYTAAEKILSLLDEERRMDDWTKAISTGELAVAVASAQVHATLALAAATGNNEASRGQIVNESNEWYRVAGVKADL